MQVAAFPLYWPIQHPRTKVRRAGRFQVDFATARKHLLNELYLLNARQIILSTNVPLRRDGFPSVPEREPVDPGVAVYFSRREKPYVIACDQFDRIRWNVRAIGATIEVLRTIERHGTSAMLEQAFSGFAALPEVAGQKPWREVLHFGNTLCTVEDVRRRVRELARTHHPDVGGKQEIMVEILQAGEVAIRELEGPTNASQTTR